MYDSAALQFSDKTQHRVVVQLHEDDLLVALQEVSHTARTDP